MKIAVYCSSRNHLAQEYVDIARAAGRWIGENGHTLVYGGVEAGLMHEVALACHDAGGRIIGVNIDKFDYRTDPLVDLKHLTRDLHERKGVMYALADAFVVLPGGLGTVDEWIASLSQLVIDRDKRRKLIICNLNNLYGSLLQYLQQLAESPFARDAHLQCMCVADDTQQMINFLTTIAKNQDEE